MKLSIEEVQKRFEKLDCKLISKEYKNLHTNLEFICNKHLDKGIQLTSLRNVNRGQCCHYCGKENSRNSRRVSDDTLKQITENAGFIYIRNELINGKRYIIYKCPHHLNAGEQKTLVGAMRKSKGNCPKCLNRDKDTLTFINEMKKINPKVSIIGEYTASHKKIKCKCKICEYEWDGIPNNLLNGEGCRKCADKNTGVRCRNTNDWFIEKMEELHPNIKILSEYITMKDLVKCQCAIDKHIWCATPDSLINGKTGCPKCSKINNGLKCRKTNDQFLIELKEMNPNILPLEEYKTCNDKIKCKCLLHDYIWLASPLKLVSRRTGCPKCASYDGENKIDSILDKWGYAYEIQYTFKDCKDIRPLPFDRYLPEFNILIEYDGEQHFNPVTFGVLSKDEAIKKYKTTCLHDEIKNEYCRKNNIPLIRIPYWEKENMDEFLFDEFLKYGVIEPIS